LIIIFLYFKSVIELIYVPIRGETRWYCLTKSSDRDGTHLHSRVRYIEYSEKDLSTVK